MIESQPKILYLTLLLAVSAGFCDTVTFVAADNTFSAHVTGNFIVFAYQLIIGAGAGAWLKLMTFPVFVLAVMAGGRLARNEARRYTLLMVEGVLLIVAALAAYLLHETTALLTDVVPYSVVMVIVFAMGLQNAFGRLFAKETLGPTTIMTGNVTQAALDLGNVWLRQTTVREAAGVSLRKQVVIIGGFLAGCLLGAVTAGRLGLESVIIPGIVMVAAGWRMSRSAQ